MTNLSPKKTEGAMQDPQLRGKNFDEVEFGYSEEQAISEAQRCLQCKTKPCVNKCPVHVDIPAFIKEIANGNHENAFQAVLETNFLPAVCGRVCPQESQCEGACVRGIKGESVAIGKLERFCADFHLLSGEFTPHSAEKTDKRIAIIGSGPAGLSCAGTLVKKGYDVTVFEALHAAGGVLTYGIPEFRLPKEIVAKEIKGLEKSGVNFVFNAVIGKIFTVDELFSDGYSAVFIGSGAGLPKFMGIKGENLNGVYSSNEFLTRINLMKAHREGFDTPVKRFMRVAVIGGGNVAIDAARCALRLGAEKVYIIYRRGKKEMPARIEELRHAEEEGIIFEYLTAPTEIIDAGDFSVGGLKCVKMELGLPDSTGRRSPREVENSEFILDVDSVLMAIGTSPNPLISAATRDLVTDKRGCIVTDEDGRTSKKYVYAGGDAVSGAATVILAMGMGKKAAEAIDKDLS